MENKQNRNRRKVYVCGRKMMSISYIHFLYGAGTMGAVAIALLNNIYKIWQYLKSSNLIVFLNFIIIIILLALAVSVAAGILKCIAWIIGRLLIAFGEPDKIEIERFNNKNRGLVEIKIENNEEEQFEGELKIMQIGNRKLPTPLSMGVFRSKENIEKEIVIPANEPISVAIGLFDKVLGSAYFPDAHNKEMFLPPKTRIYTKLSGKLLNSGIKIIKYNSWYVNYELETGKNFSLSILDEWHLGISGGNFRLTAELSSSMSKIREWFYRLTRN